MDHNFEEVPFEAQIEPRGCGAACLAMVYRSLGRPQSQAEIFPRIARQNAFGNLASITHLMARDAAAQGLQAVVVRALEPLAMLRACVDAGVHAILATRLAPGAPTGHYTVLLDIDSTHACIHDPLAGPRRELLHRDLMTLWEARPGAGEVTGGVLIAIGASDPKAQACLLCHSPVPESIACPSCGALVGLRPLAALGCICTTCPARLWERICCPECDALWDGPTAQANAVAGQPVRPAVDLGKMFAALDAFHTATLSVPGAAANGDLTRLMGELAGMRGKLEAAVAADAVARAGQAVQRQAAKADVEAQAQALRAKMPASPSVPTEPTLDAAALGRVLLERLAT